MDAPLDRYRASREELIRLIVRQRGQIAALEREQARLHRELATQRAAISQLTERVGTLLAMLAPPQDDDPPARPTTMPGLKPAPRRPSSPRSPRKPRLRGYGRQRMRPTARQVHAFTHCPHCRTPLRGGTLRRRREVIELVPARGEVIEHQSWERRCPRCRGRWPPGPELAGVVVGQGRLGLGLVSLIATLREEWRLPIRASQHYLQTVAGLRLSVGAMVATLHQVAQRAGPVVQQLGEAMRASPVLHGDETGWRQEGHNGYAWTFATATERLFVHGGRDRAVLAGVVGGDYPGVLVSDFYAVYTGYDGRHQYGWAHLLRDVDDLVEQHRGDVVVRGWGDAVQALYARAVAFAHPDAAARRRQRQAYEAELGALCAPWLGQEAAPQRVLCERITTHLAELFVCVEDPAVPPTNNAAERSLRHLVTARKISGGTRSPAGTATKMTLATLFGTWHLQGLDPLAACRALLAAPQV
jgi:transposase